MSHVLWSNACWRLVGVRKQFSAASRKAQMKTVRASLRLYVPAFSCVSSITRKKKKGYFSTLHAFLVFSLADDVFYLVVLHRRWLALPWREEMTFSIQTSLLEKEEVRWVFLHLLYLLALCKAVIWGISSMLAVKSYFKRSCVWFWF